MHLFSGWSDRLHLRICCTDKTKTGVEGLVIHVVKAGQTLRQIAAIYDVSVQRILSDNGIVNPEGLVEGQALVIQKPVQTYTVQTGDTIESIAQQTGITPIQLIRNNPSLAGGQLYAGETLAITFEGAPEGTLTVTGYAYPFINRGVLFQALPYLTYLTIFGYGFTAQGDLIPVDDAALIEYARQFGVKPVMLLSTITESGTFSTERATQMLSSPDVQARLIEQIVAKMKEKGYVGLDIDFEFVEPALRENYLAFIEETTHRLNEEGFFTTVDLAPKTSADQPGLLYEAHDYRRIGEVANRVLVMTYEWGYTYGPPMAVAPLNNVEQVLDYALTEIPREKIQMGIPNYGYDWPLPYERGKTAAETVGNLQAVQIAQRERSDILFDVPAQSPHFYYRGQDGREHVVWFEDARSIAAKLRVAMGKGLFGVSYWNLMRPFPQNWAVLNSLVSIAQG